MSSESGCGTIGCAGYGEFGPFVDDARKSETALARSTRGPASRISTLAPVRASENPVSAPATPEPTMTTSAVITLIGEPPRSGRSCAGPGRVGPIIRGATAKCIGLRPAAGLPDQRLIV